VRESAGSPYFVSMPDGAPYNDASFRRQFRAALDGCGLNQLTFHGLRHHCGVTLAELGRSQDEIMAYLGHSSPAMTAWYCKQASRKKMQKSAADAWSKAGKE